MKNLNRKKLSTSLICGIIGSLCYGFGDWIMIYGDPVKLANLKLSILTKGTANISQWRYSLSMLMAFIGILFYGTALFSIEDFIIEEKSKKIYHYLNIFGLTPWIALHLFFIMILSLFSWMNQNGYSEQAIPVCEGLFSQLSWVIVACLLMMAPVFIYWFYLQFNDKTIFPRIYAFTNVIFIIIIMKIIQINIPRSPFSLGFANGIANESMAIWFGIMLKFLRNQRNRI